MTAAMRDWQGAMRDMSQSGNYAIDNILVPLDLTSAARLALPVARVLAHLEKATVHILYPGDRPLDPQEAGSQLGLAPEDMQGAVLDPLAASPSETITRLLQQLPESLVVMSTEAGDNRRRGSLGSITDAVLAACPQRIVLVPPERKLKQWHLKRVLLAHDGTPGADIAIGPAAELAHRAGAEVTAVHIAARNAPRPTQPGSLPAPRYVDQPQHEWPAWANEFLERMLALGQVPSSMQFKLLVSGGQPGSEVAHLARHTATDLVVAAWHDQWEPRREGALKTIIRRSGCPVLLIQDRPVA
jgi:nucleotide-binding universal stress UspA family protein